MHIVRCADRCFERMLVTPEEVSAHTICHVCSGVWNVPHISSVYLVKGAWLKQHTPEYSSERYDADMAFTAWMREKVGNPMLHARLAASWDCMHECGVVLVCCRVTSCTSPTWRSTATW